MSSLPCRGSDLAASRFDAVPTLPCPVRAGWAAWLAAESEPSDDGAVARVVLLQQVCEKATALADELEEAATRMIVLRKAAEMVREGLDPLRQERDLDLRRAGIAVIDGVLGDDLLLPLGRERHSVLRHEQNYWLFSSNLTMTGGCYQRATDRARTPAVRPAACRSPGRLAVERGRRAAERYVRAENQRDEVGRSYPSFRP